MNNDAAADTEVIIAGAGPVGLALALELQRLGIRFRVVEKNKERSTTSKALGLQARLSEVFAILGIADRFFARGFDDVRALNLHVSTQKPLTVAVQFPPDRAGREAFQPQLLIIPQSVTEEILETTLAERGHQVERSKELLGFNQAANYVDTSVRHANGTEETIRAQFLISCEGAHSVIRKEAGFTFAGATFPMRFLLADVTIDWDLPPNEIQVWFHPDGSFAALPFGAQKWRLIVECAADADESRSEVTVALMQHLATKRTGKTNMTVRDPVWLSDFRINARMVDRFRDRRVFVAGDAAHIHSPAGGQGIATGIQDATNLAWKLAACLRHGAPVALLDTYDEERRPIAREVLASTTTVSHIIFALNPLARFFREQLLFPILGTSFVQRRLFAKLSQLEMNYRGRNLSLHLDKPFSRVRIRAGDRAPDVAFLQDGKKITMFQLLGSYGMIALLGRSENNREVMSALAALHIRSFFVSPQKAETQSLEDYCGDFTRIYGVEGQFLYLIRPDGHVALFQRRMEIRPLATYLKKIRRAEDVEKAFPFG